MRETNIIRGVNGTGNTNGTFDFFLPVGKFITDLILDFSASSAFTISMLTRLYIVGTKADGTTDVLVDADGTRLNALNVVDRLIGSDTSDIMRVPFGDPAGLEMPANMGLGIAISKDGLMNGFPAYDTVKVEGTYAGATVLALTPSVISADPALYQGKVKRVKEITETLIAGVNYLTRLYYGNGPMKNWKRVGFTGAAGTYGPVVIKMGSNGVEVFNRTKAVNDQMLDDGDKVHGTDFDFIVDFNENRFPGYLDTGALSQGDNNMVVELTSDTAESCVCTMEAVGNC
jgi:hypothetical protein